MKLLLIHVRSLECTRSVTVNLLEEQPRATLAPNYPSASTNILLFYNAAGNKIYKKKKKQKKKSKVSEQPYKRY